MNSETDGNFEDRVLDELLERLNDNVTPAVGTGGDPSRASNDTLVREYLELIGLIPYGLETVQPSPDVREENHECCRAGPLPTIEEAFQEAVETPTSAEAVEMPVRRRANLGPSSCGLD